MMFGITMYTVNAFMTVIFVIQNMLVRVNASSQSSWKSQSREDLGCDTIRSQRRLFGYDL